MPEQVVKLKSSLECFVENAKEPEHIEFHVDERKDSKIIDSLPFESCSLGECCNVDTHLLLQSYRKIFGQQLSEWRGTERKHPNYYRDLDHGSIHLGGRMKIFAIF
jgi:hypothetical protein